MCNKHFTSAIDLLFITTMQLISLTMANYGNTAQLINPQPVGLHAQRGLTVSIHQVVSARQNKTERERKREE